MVGHQTQEEANSQGNQQDPQHLVFQLYFEGLLSHNPLSLASRLDAPPCLFRLNGMAGKKADTVIVLPST